MPTIRKVVMHYAKLLGCSDKVGEIKIDLKECTADADVALRYNMPECDINFYKEPIENVTIIHELLHICFKNTSNGYYKLLSGKQRDVLDMLHEQEIEMLARKLAKALPKYKIDK